MSPTARYDPVREVYRSPRVSVTRANAPGGAQVVLKVHAKPFPTLAETLKLRQDYEFGSRLRDIPGVVRYLETYTDGNRTAIVMEDTGGVSLRQMLQERALDGREALAIVRGLAATLAAIHERGLVHKQIHPGHIIVDPDTLDAKLVDFGLASPLRTERQQLTRGRIEGELAYIAPEQTGRVNHPVDMRSDLYSLGITFYELLTGQVPFDAEDPLELVHCHLARPPRPPSQLDPQIPSVVSELVLRLLAKTPDERYLRADALELDLSRLERLLDEPDAAEQAVGLQRGLEQFRIPDRLYGREAESAALLAAFERAAEGRSELLLIGGYSGIGKTSLVFEIQPHIVGRRANFISGKFDQYKRNTPYASFMSAFDALTKRLLSEDDQVVEQWRTRICQAVGPSGRILTDLIPSMEFLIGPQPELAHLVGEEAARRFNEVLLRFIRCLVSPEHPLVIFVDDLQWADAGTLALVRLFMTDPEVRHLLLIGAYRDNEVDPNHPMCVMVEQLHQAQAPITTLSLSPLTEAAVGEMVAETLHTTVDAVQELVALVFEKTAGNPFFTAQLLTALHDQQVIHYSPTSGQWEWSIERARAAEISSNVVDLIAKRLRMLPGAAQDTLRIAACVGNTFDVRTLATVQGKSFKAVIDELTIGLDELLILPTSEDYKVGYVYDLDDVQDERIRELGAGATFTFLHDRVQQAAYLLTSEQELPRLHLTIGRLWHEASGTSRIDEHLFDIVDHYNGGRHLIEDEAERLRVLELNLSAARKAKDSSSFASALHYAAMAASLLPERAWESHYRLFVAVHLELGEAQFLDGSYAQALETLDVATPHLTSALDHSYVAERKVLLYKMKNDLESAWATGVGMLRRFGIEMDQFPDEATLRRELATTQSITRGRSVEALALGERMTDPEYEAACRLLQEIWPVGFFLGSLGMHVAAMKMVQLSAEHGNCPASAFGYISYAFAQVFFFMNIEDGYKMGQVALRLQDRFDNREVETKVLDLWGGLIQHYKEPIARGRETLWRGFTRGLEHGDYQWAGYCAINFSYLCVVGDTPLAEAIRHIDRVLPTLRKYDPNMTNATLIVRETVATLVEGKPDPLVLDGQWCEEAAMIRYGEQNNEKYTLFIVYFHKVLLALVFGRKEELWELARLASQTVAGSAGIWINPVFHYLHCLALLDVYDDLTPAQQQQAQQTIERNMERIREWTRHAPFNYAHMGKLVEAERARVEGRVEDALRAYEDAVATAGRLGFTHDRGLACERAAAFYRGRGAPTAAECYLLEARQSYVRWGALAKVAQLDRLYPHLAGHDMGAALGVSTTEPTAEGRDVDVLSVVKAARVISGSIQMEALLDNLVSILIENAGASFGAIIVRGEAGELLVPVRKHVHTGPVHEEGPATDADLLDRGISGRMLKYVLRTKTRLLVNDTTTTKDDPFHLQEFSELTGAKAIIALPIVVHGQVSAAAFLYNEVTRGAFTEARIDTLEVLCAQAAVSLENANLLIKAREAALVEADLVAAKSVQEALLPTTGMPRFAVQTTYQPASRTGGDWYHYFYDHQRSIARFYLGDVTGHGVPSALITGVVCGAVNALELDQRSLSGAVTEAERIERIATLLNGVVRKSGRGKHCMTMIIASVDTTTGECTLLSAGHTPVILADRRTRKCRLMSPSGWPLGYFDQTEFEVLRFQIAPGDRLLFFTDGLLENEGPTHKRLSMRRLVQLLSSWDLELPQLQDKIMSHVRRIWGDGPVEDDVALLLVQLDQEQPPEQEQGQEQEPEPEPEPEPAQAAG